MGRFWEVAPPTTWALLSVASICLLAGFVLLSHTLVRRKAHEEEWRGWTAPGRLEWTVRGGLASVLAGGFFWALALDAAPWMITLLALSALLPAALQARAVTRGKS